MSDMTGKGGVANLIGGLVALAVIIGLNWVIWWVGFAPNGVMKLYTPMYGFSILVVYLFSIIFFVDIADFWPFTMDEFSWGKGICLLIATLVLTWVMIYGVFWNLIGRFGITYFSPNAILEGGVKDLGLFSARENASTAIVYFFAVIIWVAIWWKAGFGSSPWQNISKGAATFSRFFAISFFGIIIYAIFFHPHVCYLFYPAQNMAGVAPWWAEVAQTGSAFYNLGWIICSLFILILTEVTFDGWPWKLLKKDGQGNLGSALTALIVSVVLGFLVFYLFESVMNYFWEEPFLGGNYLDAPFFRHIHAAEVAMFFILGVYILNVFFNNFPRQFNGLVNLVVRLVIVVVIGLVLRWFYYSEPLGSTFLDRVPGIGQPDDTPLCWSILLLCMIMVYDNCFNRFPLKKG
jgi:hypothetical protein